MKLSIVLSTQPASFSALAYKGHFEENINKIKNLGYDGVELAVRDPELLQMEELERVLKEAALPVPAIGTGQAYGEEGLSFTHPSDVIREKAVKRIQNQILLAKKLNADVIIGLVRGKETPQVGENQVHQWMLESFQTCADVDHTVNLVIEPINRYETDLINTVESGLRFLDILKRDNVGLLLDTFHMNIEEPSINRSLETAGDRIFHFHVADSNRWHPGAGHIDFRQVVATLDRIGYTGYLSAEILPFPDSDTAAENTIKHLKPFIN